MISICALIYLRSQPGSLCLFFIISVVLPSTQSVAQVLYPPGRIDVSTQSGGLVVPIHYPSKTEGRQDQYISDSWHTGTLLLLNGDSIHQYPLKYNLTTQTVEVDVKGVVKVVPLTEVRQFYWIERGKRADYINGSGYTMTGEPLRGCMQLLCEGKVSLFKRPFLKIQKANYRPELDVGSVENKAIREHTYYLARGRDILEVKNKSDVYDFFRQHRATVRKYAREQNLHPKEQEDFVTIVEYYNQLVQ